MEVTSLQSILLLLISLVSLSSYYIFSLYPKSKRATTNGFTTYPLVGNLPDFLRNRHRFLDWATGTLSRSPSNTTFFHGPGNLHGVITANPKIVEHMLKSNFQNYPKGPYFRSILTDLLGNGIFNSDGELWKTQRKSASYEFNTKSLRHFAMENVTVELRTRLIPILGSAAASGGRVLDFQDTLARFAFDNICKVAFNVDPGCLIEGDGTLGGEFMAAFDDATSLCLDRFLYAIPSLFVIKRFFNLGSEKKLRKSIAIVHEFADKIIRTRMEQGIEKKDEDFLSRFIGNSENSVEFLRDIVINFILAGRDTTSSALSWFFWLLSSRPDVEERILQELETIRRKTGKLIGESYSFDELREMHYLHAAISESMRLYPPVPIDTKACSEDDMLPEGISIKKGWFISYHTYAMGRMESVWGDDCCEYKPERWIENGICKQESPFKYPVFHAGLRMCLGKEMAYIQMKSIVASVLERFALEVLVEKGKCPEHLVSLTLRIKGGLPVRVKERSIV